MDDGLTSKERDLARARIRKWPLADRIELTALTETEVQNIALLTALLDIRPVEEEDGSEH